MRDISNWKNALAKSFSKSLAGLDFSPREIYETELALYVLEKLAPQAAPKSFWSLMSGYDFFSNPSKEQKQILFNARQILGRFRSVYAWKRALERYQKICLERPFLVGYDITDKSFSCRKINSVNERWDIYEKVLTQKLDYQKRHFEWAEAGEYRLEDRKRDRLYAVKIPEVFSFDILPTHKIPLQNKREKIEIVWQELLDTATSMDGVESGDQKGWRKRLDNVQLEIFNKSDALKKADKITFDGLTHLVGMVSSGKSTLMHVVAVWAARNGLHVTLVLGDVIGILDAVQDLSKFEGVKPAPILGSGRESHLKRLHRVTTDRQKESFLTPQHEGFRWLSTACPLDALRQDTPQYAFDLNFRPCLDLKDGNNKKGKACPIFPICPYHQAQRGLTEANVWIASSASLVFARPATQINAENVRFAELVAQKSDLVIIDEADRVQVQLDDIFSPHQILCGAGDSDGWLDELERQVGERTAINGRNFVTQDGLEDWRQAFHHTQMMADLAYNKLRASPELRKWLENEESFSELTLTDTLAKELSGDKDGKTTDYEKLRKKFDHFIDSEIVELFGRRDVISTEKSSGLRDFAVRLLMSGDSLNWFHELKDWIKKHKLSSASKNKKIDEVEFLTKKLELTIIVAVLSNRLNNLLENWRTAADRLRIEELTSRLSFGSPRDYQNLIPSAPMGNVLAFQFKEHKEEGKIPKSTLSFYRFTGVGRWLLLNLHRLLEAEGIERANVVLLSGTSWAGETASYHVQTKVDGILAAPDEEIEAISTSKFEFLPQTDEKGELISVSGSQGEYRKEALRKMLRSLATPDEFGNPSHFEETLNNIEQETRRRILLVVGSYHEADVVFDQLQNIRSDWKNKIVRLKPDHEEWIDENESVLRRGDLPNFPEKDKFILIAPLQAIERGHNILAEVEDAGGKRKVAAIGAAYFLVRPHPQPKDLGYTVRALNSWTIQNSKDLSQQIAEGKTLDEVSHEWRVRAQRRWRSLLRETVAYSLMEEDKRDYLTWYLLVSIWQVIGRLVRGGQPARVFFCDAKFNPMKSEFIKDVSLLKEMKKVLAQYIEAENGHDTQIVRRLYAPLYTALSKMKNS